MAKAMQYGKGLINSRFDIVLLNQNHLDFLFDDKVNYYGRMKDRFKQVLPTHIDEIRTNVAAGIHELYQSSAMEPFFFNNGTVKKIDRYMSNFREQFHMGFDFFKKLYDNDKTNKMTDSPALPIMNQHEMMTKTRILKTVIPPVEIVADVLQDNNDNEIQDAVNALTVSEHYKDSSDSDWVVDSSDDEDDYYYVFGLDGDSLNIMFMLMIMVQFVLMAMLLLMLMLR